MARHSRTGGNWEKIGDNTDGEGRAQNKREKETTSPSKFEV